MRPTLPILFAEKDIQQVRVTQMVQAALVAGTVLGGSLAAAGPAAASPDSAAASPESVCGSGYQEIDSHDLPGLATVYLLYNGSTNCVVTKKTAYEGKPTFISAGVDTSPPTWEVGKTVDQGEFKYYAGPKYVHAPGKCVSWAGSAAPLGQQNPDLDHIFFSQPSHCD
ncbi:hypothetical protein ACQP1G_38885 [Nocardia sp. CA-107356]|uniref:hypothetical protein n=1 Tax=Nocardia sp. CA-107356 TaxID=3239972 RepID=UPI003D8FEDDD